jgi:magnesium transporter
MVELTVVCLNEDVTAADAGLTFGLVDAGLYISGHRIATPNSFGEARAGLADHPEAMAWIGLYRPTSQIIRELGEFFGFNERAAAEALSTHHRSKLKRFGETLYVALTIPQYIDAHEDVDFGELHILMGSRFVITVRQSDTPDLRVARRRMETRPDELALGPEAVLFGILDQIVDEDEVVVTGLEKDVVEIEAEVFSGKPDVSRRIYLLSREVIDFQRSTRALREIIRDLERGFRTYQTQKVLQGSLGAIEDHLEHVIDRTDETRSLLRDMLTVNATMITQEQNEEMTQLSAVSNRQNDEVKKISAWAAIIFAPSLVGTTYGMNFTHMPELNWQYGYPMALGLMLATSVALFATFKAKGWL